MVNYIARTLSKDISCRAGQVRVLFCLPDYRFLPNSLATGQVVMLHTGQVEIVAIVMPLIFGHSLLILCGYFTNIFEIREHFLLCSLIIIKVLSSKFYEIQ